MAFYDEISDTNNFVISFTKNPQQDFSIFAKGYKRSASLLAKSLLERNHFSDYEAYPVVFLYRQAFELYLKGFYYKARLIAFFKNSNTVECQHVFRHRLEPLAKAFQKICKILFPSEQTLLQFTDKVHSYATEFEEIDKNSFSYRYPIDTKGNPSTKHHQIVNLLAFHNSMEELLSEMENVDFGFDIEAFQTQEIYEILQEVETTLASGNSDEVK